MRSFLHNHKGAVTVFITALLVPAILVTGTAVDLARIYAARGVVRDANQLAANAALANYDAMLKEVYGLFALSQDDEELAEMLDTYVRVSIFGKNGGGQFSLLSSKDTVTVQPVYYDGSNFANPAVLRRQIEEYSKFRAPAAFVETILDKIDSFTHIPGDTAAVLTKIELDNAYKDLVDKYGELYFRIRYNDYYTYLSETLSESGIEPELYDYIEWQLSAIPTFASFMVSARSDYFSAKSDYDDASDELDAMDEISDLVQGEDEEDEDFEERVDALREQRNAVRDRMDSASGRMSDASDAFNESKADAVSDLGEIEDILDILWSCGSSHPGNGFSAFVFGGSTDYYMKYKSPCCLESYSSNIEQLEKHIEELRKSSEKIERITNQLRVGLDYCSAETREHMETALEGDYFIFDVDELTAITNGLSVNKSYITGFNSHLNNMPYSIPGTSYTFSLSGFKSFFNSAGVSATGTPDTLSAIADASGISFPQYSTPPGSSFVRFANMSVEAADYYNRLSMLFINYEDAESNEAKDAFDNFIGNLIDDVKSKVEGIYDFGIDIPNIPDFDGASGDSESSISDKPKDSEIDSMGENTDAAESSLNSAQDMFNNYDSNDSTLGKVLLLAYDTNMFSSFPSQDGKMMTGIPFGTDINYMLGAEREYLLHGSKSSTTNLAAFAGLLLATRFVFNYISTFLNKDARNALTAVQACFAWSPPLALVMRELARVGIALVESVIDVAGLRGGDRVPIVKITGGFDFLNPANLLADIGKDAVKTLAITIVRTALEELVALEDEYSDALQDLVSDTEENMTTAAQYIDSGVKKMSGGTSEVPLKPKTEEFYDKLKTQSEEKIAADTPDVGDGDTPDVGGDTPDIDGDGGGDGDDDDDDGPPKLDELITLSYDDYLSVFLFMFVGENTLAIRTSELIAINLTNKISGIGGLGSVTEREEAMAAAELYDMTKAYTYIGVKTDVDLRFIFMSQPLAQSSWNGLSVRPPQTFSISEVDYRGY